MHSFGASQTAGRPSKAANAGGLCPTDVGRVADQVCKARLVGGLSRPIDIEHQVAGSLPVPQPTRLLVLLQWPGYQDFEITR